MEEKRKVKSRRECTFLGYETFNGYGGQSGKKFVTLSFIDHYGEQNEKMRCLSCTINEDRLKAAMEYRGIKQLEINKRYEVWLQDYKGDKKLKFSGIKPLQ